MRTIEHITSIANVTEGLEAEVLCYTPTGRYGVAIIDHDAGKTLPRIQYRFASLYDAIVAAHKAVMLDNPVGLTQAAINNFYAYCRLVDAPNPPKSDEIWGKINAINSDLTAHIAFIDGRGRKEVFMFDATDYIYG